MKLVKCEPYQGVQQKNEGKGMGKAVNLYDIPKLLIHESINYSSLKPVGAPNRLTVQQDLRNAIKRKKRLKKNLKE